MKMKTNDKKLRIASIASSTATLISAHNVCHSLCMGLIAFLAVFGIAIVGMPLAFLQEYNIYFWSMAFITLIIMLAMIIKKWGCVSNKTLLFNFGLLIAGFPFAAYPIDNFLLVAGGLVALTAIGWFAYEKFGVENLWNRQN
ncbi:MAG TPA: hypothetical protein VI933_01495 [archaeon]|nr:hypothetical protein [archaeon]